MVEDEYKPGGLPGVPGWERPGREQEIQAGRRRDIFLDLVESDETRREAKARVHRELYGLSQIRQETIRINDRTKPVTHEELVDLMSRISRDRYRDSWGNTTDDIRRMNLALHPLTQKPVSYHMRPKEFMQGMGGGLPYNRYSGIHFAMRYGMRPSPGIRVGILRKTPRQMAERAARKRAEMDAYRLLFGSAFG